MTETLVVDDLSFEVRRSPRRKTVGLTVDRDGTLHLAAPPDADRALLQRIVREKQFWLYAKLAEKETRQRELPAKEYVNGEGFPYLGRRYRLMLVDGQDRPLKLEAGRFRLRRAEAPHGRRHFVRWYSEHGQAWLARRVPPWARRIGVEPAGVGVRDLGYRWGSCGKRGTVYFHWVAMQAPPSIVDYVIVHELVHLLEAHHTPRFWRRVERALPDYERRKQWLAERGHELVL